MSVDQATVEHDVIAGLRLGCCWVFSIMFVESTCEIGIGIGIDLESSSFLVLHDHTFVSGIAKIATDS